MIIFIIVAAILFFSFSTFMAITMPGRRGRAGENKVSKILSKLPYIQYRVINDILIKTSHGSTQIDHVVLSEYGIFVIETKNYTGWILGGEYSEEWTKNVYGQKYQFRNPLKQNYAHVKALMEVLEINTENVFIPIIAFSNQADIKVQCSKDVVNFRQLKNCILRYQNHILPIDKMVLYEAKLQGFTKYSKDDKSIHVAGVRARADFNKANISMGICPNCAGKLVERKGKYGKFLGCSNYPRCRFTYNL